MTQTGPPALAGDVDRPSAGTGVTVVIDVSGNREEVEDHEVIPVRVRGGQVEMD